MAVHVIEELYGVLQVSEDLVGTLEPEVELNGVLGQAPQISGTLESEAPLAGNYVYDVWVELAGGARHPVIEYSSLVIYESVTTFA